MALANCRHCGDLFYTFSQRLECPRCLEKEHHALDLVRQYIRTSHERSIQVIAAETGVEVQQILKWIRGNRLTIAVVPGELTCYRCGVGITSGRFCTNCQSVLAGEITRQRQDAGRFLRRKQHDTDADADAVRGFVRGPRVERVLPPDRKTEAPAKKPSAGMHLRG